MGGGDEPQIPNDEIWYTSSDGNAVAPHATDGFGATIVSNTYSGGKGIIKFDGNVTSIGNSAFEGCTGITSVTIGNGVKGIGAETFSGCTGLASITIPNSVTRIGGSAFSGCTGITSVKVEATTPPTLDDKAFNKCTALTEILVPSASVDAYKTATRWSTYANIIKGF